jgi:hypothetical protein
MLSGQIIDSQWIEVLDAAILLWFHDGFEQLICVRETRPPQMDGTETAIVLPPGFGI